MATRNLLITFLIVLVSLTNLYSQWEPKTIQIDSTTEWVFTDQQIRVITANLKSSQLKTKEISLLKDKIITLNKNVNLQQQQLSNNSIIIKKYKSQLDTCDLLKNEFKNQMLSVTGVLEQCDSELTKSNDSLKKYKKVSTYSIIGNSIALVILILVLF